MLQTDDAGQQIRPSISLTTRQRRDGEIDGQHYHFVTPKTFDRMVADGHFLEYERVFGHSYGTSKTAVEAMLSDGCSVLLEIDWKGARHVLHEFGPTRCDWVLVVPPTFEDLRSRLKTRDTDDEQEQRRRMALAQDEITNATPTHVVVNDDLEEALKDLTAIAVHHTSVSEPRIVKSRDALHRLVSARLAH